MAVMVLGRFTSHENVIKVDEDKINALQYVVHQHFERLGCITQSKRHSHEFEEAEGGDDGRLMYVIGRHGYLVVSFDQIDLGNKSNSPLIELQNPLCVGSDIDLLQ